MKIILIFLFLFSALSYSFGNAGVFRGRGQTPVLEKNSQIQMVSEEIEMIPRPGKRPVDLSLRNMDKMDFRCRFVFRNLTEKSVTLPVGFPLGGAYIYSHQGKYDQKELIARFAFSASVNGKKLPVRFVPYDKKRKFSQLFLWEMTFPPKQQLELLVNYTMEGGMGLGTTRRLHNYFDQWIKYKCDCLNMEMFTINMIQTQMYITETGSSWAGTIEKAVFRYYHYEFEKYLAKRGAWEESAVQRKKRLEERKKKPGILFSPEMPMRRMWNPAFEKWHFNKDKKCLELVFHSWKPQKKDNIQITYSFYPIPCNEEEFELVCKAVRSSLEQERTLKERFKKENPKLYKKYWASRTIPAFGPVVRKNLADWVLEFHGIPRNNPDLADYLADQQWYPVKKQYAISSKYKQMLLNISAYKDQKSNE